MEKLIVIIEVIAAIGLTYLYYRLCSGREMSITAKIAEIFSMYSLNILAYFGKIKFWVLLIGFAVLGVIKILTTKKNERRNKGLIG